MAQTPPAAVQDTRPLLFSRIRYSSPAPQTRAPYQQPSYILGRSASAGPRDSFAAPSMSVKYAADALLAKRMGVTTDQVLRQQALKRLGLREEDLKLAQEILRRQRGTPRDGAELKKEELLTGYTSHQMHRSKALGILGVTEEFLDEEISKELSSLGIGGRKRSFPHRPDTHEHLHVPAYEEEYLQKLYNAARIIHSEDPPPPSTGRFTPRAGRRPIPTEETDGRRTSVTSLLRELLGVNSFDEQPSYGELWLLYQATMDRRIELEHEVLKLRKTIEVMTQKLQGTRNPTDPEPEDDADIEVARISNDADERDSPQSSSSMGRVESIARVSPITTPHSHRPTSVRL